MSARSILDVFGFFAAQLTVAGLVFPFCLLLFGSDGVREIWDLIRQEVKGQVFLFHHQSVDCLSDALVLLALGQSNAANNIPIVRSLPTSGNTYSYFRGRCYAASDPLPGADGTGASVWTLLATWISERTGLPVIIISRARGGSSIERWASAKDGLSLEVAKIVSGARDKGLNPRFAIWIQGEADARLATSFEDYIRKLKATVQTISAGASDLIWIVVQATRCQDTPAENRHPVRKAQQDISAVLPNVVAGPDLDVLGDDFRYDGWHFNERGRETIVDWLLVDIVKHLNSSSQRTLSPSVN